jgi:hypothetical protein
LGEQIEPSELNGARILVGVTREFPDGSYEQEQHSGIARVEDRGSYCLVLLDCSDGVERDYPFDARTLQRAQPGEYRLRSTGEVVKDPDFLMTWTVTKDQD